MPRTKGLWVLATLTLTTLAVAKLDTWKQETATAFGKGRRDKVVLADSGKIKLAKVLVPTPKLTASRVWDLARSKSGITYAATGDAGQVFAREKAGDWTVLHDHSDSQALSLLTLPGGNLMVGTGPSGQVVELLNGEPKLSRIDSSVQYIWDLAGDEKGNIYAATGPAGGLWKRTPAGVWSAVLKSKHAHLLCVAVGPDGSVYAGSDGEGILYKVDSAGKVSVLYDAGPSEIRCILLGPDGTIFAGTAAESSGGNGSGRSSSQTTVNLTEAETSKSQKLPVTTQIELPKDGGKTTPDPTPGGTATPKPVAPGENAVYRIGADGTAREIFRAKTLIYSLAWHGGRIMAGTGPEGILYDLDPFGHEATPIVKLDHGQILSLLSTPEGELVLGAGDPGAVFQLGSSYQSEGTFTSDVYDAKIPAQFGAVSWRGDAPDGTSVTVQIRTGNLAEPDSTWSDWSAPMTDPATALAKTSSGRFAQYRATLKTSKLETSPTLSSVVIRFKTHNLPPEITKLDIPDISAADGATRQTKLNLKWEATDPNGDELSYRLSIRKNGWPDWIKIGENSITESSYSWDTTALPTGTYQLKLTASDRLSNPTPLTREKVSEPFLIDHQAPVITIARNGAGAVAHIDDELTRITKAAYALDGGEWTPAFADDELFDRPREQVTIKLTTEPGTHVLTVRATDAAGNTGTADLVFTIPAKP